MTQGFHTTFAKGFLVWRDSKERCVHCNWPIVRTFGRHSCVARATAIYILHIVQSFRSYSTIDWYSTCFPRNQKQQCRSCPQKSTICTSRNDPGEIISNLGYSTSFPRNQNNSVEIAYISYKNLRYTFDKSAEKIDGRVLVLIPMSRLRFPRLH